MKDLTGKMVRITDIGNRDSRYSRKDKMIGMIGKVIKQFHHDDGWFHGEITSYPSQKVKIYGGNYYNWPLNDKMIHYNIKVEEI